MKKATAAVIALLAVVLGAQPAFGDDEGTVAAQVTVAAPCIQVTPAQLDFGTLGLSSAASTSGAARPLTATNCGAASSLLGRGTDATSTGGASWTLVGSDLCSAPNRYQQRVDTGPASIPLVTQDTTLRSLAAAEVANLNAIVVMPCTGSSGAGQVMTFSYVFTAVLA